MLGIPEEKFRRSVNVSNVERIALGDWLEASTLFDDHPVTKSDVVDLLIEHQICDDGNQDLAHQIADEGWDELLLRRRWNGLPDSVNIAANREFCSIPWQNDPIRSFCLMLAIQRIFPDWAKGFQDSARQGDIFERIVEVLGPGIFPGWNVYRAGWAPGNAVTIAGIVADLRDRIYTRGAADMDAWTTSADNDGGLDLVCYRSFGDEREATPHFFLQCASGSNWRNKVDTPNSRSWAKYLNSAVDPSTGIVAPFIINDMELRRAALQGQVIVIDRVRLISAQRSANIILEKAFADEIVAWLTPRIAALPRV